MKSPTVHIVTINWNGLEDTLECLESLSKLTYEDATTVVVDNGSQNNEAVTIEARFPKVVVLKQSENLGFCGGCNVGIKYAMEKGADYVMLLNNDTLVPPDLIEKLLTGLDGLENVGAVSPIILEFPETERMSISDVKWDSYNAKFVLRGENDVYADFSERPPYITGFTCGCCLLTSTEIFRMKGLFDERYFAFFDEADWCERLRREGFDSYIVPAAYIYHKGSRSTSSLISVYLMTRNRLLWMKENLPFRVRVRSFPLLIKEVMWHMANVLGLTKEHFTRQHSRAALRGYHDYFRGRFYKWDADTEKIIFEKSKNDYGR